MKRPLLSFQNAVEMLHQDIDVMALSNIELQEAPYINIANIKQTINQGLEFLQTLYQKLGVMEIVLK